MDASQDLFGPGSEACSTDLQPCCDSATPDLLQQDPQPAAPDPSDPSSPCGAQPPLPHAQFLQSLCALQRVEQSGLEALWFGPDGGAGSLLADSVCRLLDSVLEACRDPPPMGSGDPVSQACRVAARAMDLFCSQRPSAEFKDHVEEALRGLTALLLDRDPLSSLQSGVSSSSRCFVVLFKTSHQADRFPASSARRSAMALTSRRPSERVERLEFPAAPLKMQGALQQAGR
ncbi:hypothetical protein EYF80_045015 [Liparis tanakae]|uniref:Uncharacterized protein n=1 Tax=Liparis tanakae TaxID=230148 RepID=A0A4Z2FU74_9TELE|nr:hypothetical protein EYF80_045015 [Liparis tanakae]